MKKTNIISVSSLPTQYSVISQNLFSKLFCDVTQSKLSNQFAKIKSGKYIPNLKYDFSENGLIIISNRFLNELIDTIKNIEVGVVDSNEKEDINILKSENEKLKENISELKKEYEGLKNKYNYQYGEHLEAKSKIISKDDSIRTLEKNLNNEKSYLDIANQNLEIKDKALFEMKKKLNINDSIISKINEDKETQKNQISLLNKEIENYKDEEEDVVAKNCQLKQKNKYLLKNNYLLSFLSCFSFFLAFSFIAFTSSLYTKNIRKPHIFSTKYNVGEKVQINKENSLIYDDFKDKNYASKSDSSFEGFIVDIIFYKDEKFFKIMRNGKVLPQFFKIL